ncbi:M23 family metallopeptidase [Actinocatenispora sera]|uniref:M23 family metallopeptidase n=1 Tax=Actinocatenispora sera TaxID=390989 RepID=UPI001FD11279|nr:M23 family metallopeptidase [Actinocatenispora sera]
MPGRPRQVIDDGRLDAAARSAPVADGSARRTARVAIDLLRRHARRPGRSIRGRWIAAVAAVAALAICGVLAAQQPARGGPAGPAPAPRAGYRWPLPGTPAVVRAFDPPPKRWLPGHRGVDLGGAAGTPVLAAGPGVVAYAGHIAGIGVISIEHAGGLRTTYQPVRPLVHAGEHVTAGERIGILDAGHPGCRRGACLHWGLRRGEQYLDPLSLLGFGRVRLLPLAPERAA